MTRLAKVLDDELAAQGVDAADLNSGDVEYAEAAIRGLVSRLKARRSWEAHLGTLLSHRQTLDLTGWSKQALSQAVRNHRVLRLEGSGGHGYLLAGFDDQVPARPVPGLKEALLPWAAVDPRGWAAASWLVSPQPELGGRTPLESLPAAGARERVAAAARQAAARLAA
ncbi:antitoxin Xre/MbcA/ParS toxin-binding domain-containing protein [[Mycobacterium] vasticus]|uniref:Antitoxin Xre/MbcA/ParS toxin-binding domain-containing protein n=1 Tax=[Mycobacterium] vasticus TaxID=2875777 RepID=A0ABU5YW44_9MYCO|nr:antitoxin Xre/MbcA/ParS toxin-binding domain-containing protein [Mycolicibacter sp. MYC017]MEB3069307.1 antitoxin Xre/MbcA/ParS toxin-binding domain-containing protein [Mycolicibacter sp. MYC017]